MSNRKRGQCWVMGCEKKYVAQIRVKLDYGTPDKEYRIDYEIRACKNHFALAFDSEYLPMISRWISEQPKDT